MTVKFQPKGYSTEEIYQIVDAQLEHFLKKGLPDAAGEYKLERFPEKREMKLQSKWANGHLTVGDQAVQLSLELAWLAVPFKAKVEESLQRWFHKNFPVRA